MLAPVRLFLVRHAKAAPGSPDELRALNERGREQARELGERFAEEPPDVVLSSPLLRARETADAIARAAGVPLRIDDRLAPGATAEGLLEALAGVEGSVVAVGHQPDCGEIAAALSGGPEPPFPTAGVVEIELHDQR
jgi:phosphohistidine phosphatase SixA